MGRSSPVANIRITITHYVELFTMAGFNDSVSSYARKLGSALLGQGTGRDATAATQEAYRQHVIDAQSNGRAPIPYAELAKQYNAPR